MITIEKYSGVFENHFAITSNFTSLQRAMRGVLHTFILKSKVFSVKKSNILKDERHKKNQNNFSKCNIFADFHFSFKCAKIEMYRIVSHAVS